MVYRSQGLIQQIKLASHSHLRNSCRNAVLTFEVDVLLLQTVDNGAFNLNIQRLRWPNGLPHQVTSR